VVEAVGGFTQTAGGKIDYDKELMSAAGHLTSRPMFLVRTKCAKTPHRDRMEWTCQRYPIPGSAMSSEKSVVIKPPEPKHICPVCQKPAYSLGGIHPQCALEQADAPRLVKLRAARAAEQKIQKPARQPWQKQCPKCGAASRGNRKVCSCGHHFAERLPRAKT
jgi:hypothetical protein